MRSSSADPVTALASAVEQYHLLGDVGALLDRVTALSRTADPDLLIAAAAPFRDLPEVVIPVYERVVAARADDAQSMVILANAYWLTGRGADVVGPVPADTLFHYAWRGDYDAVVAMYHDQGLAPLKMVAFESGVNWTLGLPFIRTSPDHGTAYDIVGRGVADPGSMIAALRLAKRLARHRV